LLLHDAARPDEDRCRAGFVDGHARARDLGGGCAPQLDQLARRVDDRDHDAVAALARVCLGGFEYGVGADVVDHLAGAEELHLRLLSR
jgi:hypothetical protein